jgi:light-harvesting complex I chlorophyll a/b binding protein 4
VCSISHLAQDRIVVRLPPISEPTPWTALEQEEMVGQDLPVQESSLQLSLEAAQTTASHNARTGKRQLVLGMAGLALIGVAVCGAVRLSSHAESTSQASFAFTPVITPKSFRTATRDPVYVSMNGGQNLGDDKLIGHYPHDEWSKPHDVSTYAETLAKRMPNTVGSPMSMLAIAAMASGGDPGQLASVFAVMPEEEVEKVEEIKVTVLEKAKNMAGVTGPLDFFDPLGFCTECTEGKLCFYREVELKHGRVAMLASLGFIVGEQFHPLFGGNIDVPSYLAFQQTPLQTFWPAVVAAIAIPEVFSVFSFNSPLGGEPWSVRADRESGDLGFDPLGLKPEDAKELKEMQTKELVDPSCEHLDMDRHHQKYLSPRDMCSGASFPAPHPMSVTPKRGQRGMNAADRIDFPTAE